MILDIIFGILVVLAIIQGFRKGLIIAIFTLVAYFIGLAAAIKLSVVVARYLGDTVKVSTKWLPILSFIVVFIIVILLVRLGAKLLQKTAEALTLGWLNRLGGIIFYLLIYLTIYSIILFYASQAKIIQQKTIEASVTYSFIQPWGPRAMDALGAIIPFFKDMFTELENFFERVSGKLSAHV
jgi:membrane protein required for colicin V production